MRNIVEVELRYVCADEYGDTYTDGEIVECPVYAEDRGEHFGTPCSEDVVDAEPVEERAKEIIKEIHDNGGKVYLMTANGEYIYGLDLDTQPSKDPDVSSQADEADFRRDEARDEEALRQLEEMEE